MAELYNSIMTSSRHTYNFQHCFHYSSHVGRQFQFSYAFQNLVHQSYQLLRLLSHRLTSLSLQRQLFSHVGRHFQVHKSFQYLVFQN